MKFTVDWLKDHLETKKGDQQILNKLTDIGLEVESFESQASDLDVFVIAQIKKVEQHPNADRLSVCDVDIGKKEIVKVVCGAPNAKKDLLTIYAPPGAVIPKNSMKLTISKIRGVTSYGMLCSGAELKLSGDSDGIVDLSSRNYKNLIGKKYFKSFNQKVIDISITPNRPDCLGVRGIARDLAASGIGKLKKLNSKKIKLFGNQNIPVKILNEKNQGCMIFGSCLISGVKNNKSPKWLKDKIIALGQKPISAIVDITNYVMLDLNRPLHAYDAEKIDTEIIVRNSKKGETFQALDNKEYTLDDGMCVISDKSGVLGLGGIIGGTRSGTEISTKNILLESAYFDPKSIRKTSRFLNIDTDAKYRFERGIDPSSIEIGLQRGAELIQKICGGKISKVNIKKYKQIKKNNLKFFISFFEKITGFKIEKKEIIKILTDLGFQVRQKKNYLDLAIPSWRPDITQEVDVVEELARIKGYEKIIKYEPEKLRLKQTLNNQQKLFHFLQRSVASKGYFETVTWSFTDSKINKLFLENKSQINIVNPISSDLDVLRSSVFSNLIIYLKKNIDRGFKDISLFEIGPSFFGRKPGEQQTVIAAIRAGKIFRHNWIEKDRVIDVFDAKRDVIQSLTEIGFDQNKIIITDKAPSYYHPGKSGTVYLEEKNKKPIAFFGEMHPNILNNVDIKTEAVVIFEIILDNLDGNIKKLKDTKEQYQYSDFQKSERDFAFIINKDFKSQDLIDVIYDVNKDLIRDVKVFDIYEGENIAEGQKSIALNVTIQSSEKTLTDEDLDKINKLIISTVEEKTGSKIRS